MKYFEKLGGRKFFGWQLITLITTVALFCSKITSTEFVTLTIGAFAILTGINAAQKYIQKDSQKIAEK